MQKSPHYAKKLIKVIYSDVCGPLQLTTFSGKWYFFVTFTDEYLHMTTLFLLQSKSEVTDTYALFVAFAKTQTGKVVNAIRCDNGGEYTSSETTKFCKRRVIEQKFTSPYTSQLNIVAKRMNRTLFECARCMIEHARLLKTYWGEAVMAAAFLRNRCPTQDLNTDKLPDHVRTGR